MITANRIELSAALEQAASLTKKKSTIPVTKHALVKAGKANLVVSATDLDTALAISVPCKGDGFIALPPCAELASIVRSMAGEEVGLDSDTKTVTVSAGGSTYSLKALEPEDFPTPPKMPDDAIELRPNAGFLAEAIARTVPFSAPDAIGGAGMVAVKMSVIGGRYTFDATDAKRASRYSFPAAGEATELTSALLTRESLGTALAILKSGSTDLALRVGGGRWELATKKTRAISRMVDAPFPNFDQMVFTFDASASVDRVALIAAVSRLALLRGDSEVVVMEGADAGALTLSYANRDVGHGTETVEATVAGKILPLSLKASQLLGALAVAKSERVKIEAYSTNPGSFIRISEDAKTDGGAEWFCLLALIMVAPK